MQQSSTFLLQGGLDLATPPAAATPGQVIAGVNYEPDVEGYRRLVGYERYDGQTSPSSGADASEIATLRAAINAVPGAGPIRGGAVYNGANYVFRDTAGGAGAMWKSTAAGWVQQTFGHVVNFTTGTAEFLVGETLVGGTSAAIASIKRVVLQTGTWSGGDAAGYLVISGKTGTFVISETITSSSGSANCTGEEQITLDGGGIYRSFVFNFYGPAFPPRLYFTNGVNTAMEWDGETLTPIRSGTDVGPLNLADYLEDRADDELLTRDGERLYLRFDYDIPQRCAPFSNHLFLGFRNGAIVHSGVGEPADFRASAGAGTFSVSGELTGLLSGALTALVIFTRERVEYLTGNDSSDFVKATISDTSGAHSDTTQMLNEPVYFDDAGLRKLSAADSFGDWRMGTETYPIQPLIRSIQDAGTLPAASLRIKNKDQYRLFFDDGTGLAINFSLKKAQIIPIKLPITVTCAWAGELSVSDGRERVFVGGDDGYVYEMEKGTSFDGAAIPAYLRMVWNHVGAPAQNKRWHSATFGVDATTAVTIGVVHHVDYGRNQEGTGSQSDYAVSAGSMTDWMIDDYDNIDWTVADQGELKAYLDGFGKNIAVSLISESATEDPHVIRWAQFNYSPRSQLR